MSSNASPQASPSALNRAAIHPALRPENLKTAAAFLLTILTARSLGLEDFGLFASATGVIAILLIWTRLNLDSEVEADIRRNPAEGAISLGTCMTLRVAAAATSYLALVLVTAVHGGSLRTVWLVAALALLLEPPISASVWLRAAGHDRRALMTEYAAFGLSVVIRSSLIFTHVPVGWFAAGLALESTLVALILFYHHGTLAPADDAFGWDPARAKRWWKKCWFGMVAALVAVSLIPLNQALTAWLASPAEAAEFTSAAVLIEAALFGLSFWVAKSFERPLPRLTQPPAPSPLVGAETAAVRDSDSTASARSAATAAPEEDLGHPAAGPLHAMCKLTWPIVIVLAAAAPWIVRGLFGYEFQDSATPLRILAVALLPAAVGLVRHKQWESSPLEPRLWGALAVGLGLNLIGMAILAPRFGATGAAASTSLSILTSQLLMTFWWSDSRELARQQLRAIGLAEMWKHLRKSSTVSPVAKAPEPLGPATPAPLESSSPMDRSPVANSAQSEAVAAPVPGSSNPASPRLP
jgi:O-antigen/teichoic acid export membrane protein